MVKALRGMKIRAFIILGLEVVLAAAFVVLYLFNFFDFQNLIQPFWILIGSIAILVVDGFYVWIIILRVSSIRKRSDLQAAEIIGSDVQEAYNFGMIGLVVVDDQDLVLWTNDLFKERQINILDKNILDWMPKLRELKDSAADTVVKLDISARNYEVKFLQDAGLYIFKDTTEYESVYNYSKEQAPVVGTIMIDNYSDLSGNTDDANDVISKVRNAIFDYGKEYGLLLRRYKSDAYLVFCNYISLSKMQKDGFSLLDKIRIIGAKEDTPPTLSIGFAHDFPDVVKLNDMANNAIDIAMSRGGDQVVVSRYGADLIFYGGKSEAQEKRNKVKVRVLADSLISLIKNSSDIFVMGHTEMDMDSLGSALGILAICNYVNKPAKLIYESKLTEKKTKGAITTSFSREELLNIAISNHDAVEKIKPNTLVIVVDVHRPSMTMCPKVLEMASKIVVIDHHRRAEDFIESPVFSYIEPSASSASELVAELIRYSSANPRIPVSPTYATIMLAGIFLDTNFYKSKSCGIRTFEASMILKEYGADNSAADDFLKDEYEEYSLITKIMSTLSTPYYGVVYCTADDKDIIERATIAKVANQCMQMKGINACFVIGNTGEHETRISARSDGTINVQLLSEKMGGGGHFTGAATLLMNSSIDDAEKLLLDTLDEFLNDARSNTTDLKGK